MIWYDLIWYMISHDRAWLSGQIAFPQWPQWCVVVFSSSETLLVLCFQCAPYLSWEACSVQTYLVRMCCKNIQQEHALHTFCQVFLKQCRAWPWSPSSWHRVDSVWHCKIWISIMRITDVSCRKAPTRFRSYKASQSSHASQTLQALQGDYVVTTFFSLVFPSCLS